MFLEKPLAFTTRLYAKPVAFDTLLLMTRQQMQLQAAQVCAVTGENSWLEVSKA